MPKIYIAGPLFTVGERTILERIDEVCKKHSNKTYLPHRDGGIFNRIGGSVDLFRKDVSELLDAAIVIAVLNGNDVDSGTSWEIGYAFALDKRIIGFVEDSRIFSEEGQINLMILNSLDSICHNFKELDGVIASI